MRLAIDVQSLCNPHPSGVGHALLETLRAWLADPNVELVLFSIGRRAARLPIEITSRPNVRHVHRRVPSKLMNPLCALGVISLEQLIGCSVDAAWFPNTGYLPRTRATTFLTVHDLAWALMPETYTWVHHLRYRITRARWWIRHADHVVVPSKATRDDVVYVFDRDPATVHVISHGIDHTVFDARPRPDDATRRQRLGVRQPYTVSIATREPRKNLVSLVEAFDELRRRGHHINLVLAGGRGWKRRAFDRAVGRSPYKNNIVVLDFVPDGDRPALLRGALCLCLPSRYEGFGMQVVEAMACGVPVVTARNSSLLEVGQDAALYIRSMNVRELTDVLEQLVVDPTLRATLRARGLDKARVFSWRQAARQITHIISTGRMVKNEKAPGGDGTPQGSSPW